MEQNASSNTAPLESAFSILRLLSDERIQVQGPDEAGGYTLRAAGGEVPEGASALLEALEGLDSLRVPAERLGKDLRRFLKDRDLTGGGMLLLAGLRLFFIRQEGPDAYGLLMDRRFQETAPMPEIRLERLIAALRAMDGQKGLFHTTLRRVYRAVDIPGILLEGVRITALEPHETAGLSVEGKVFVLAGGLTREERARAKALITAQGGRCAGSLSGRTDYLAAGTVEKLRENTLLQFRTLQSKGREIQLLTAASLFALLGEAVQETGNPAETASAPSMEMDCAARPSIPETGTETDPAAEGPSIPEAAAAEAGPLAEGPSIPEPFAAEAVPAIPEEPALPAASLPEESAPMPEISAAEASEPSAGTVPDAPAAAAAMTAPQEIPERSASPESPGAKAAETVQPAAEPVWDDAWESAREAARAAKAQATAKASAQVQQLQEALAAKERHLRTLSRWKFGERAAARQEIHRLNQALRTAKAELSRLSAGME